MAKRKQRARAGSSRPQRGPQESYDSAALDWTTRHLPWLARVVPALLAVAAYLNSLHGPFVYDDHRTVVNNPSLKNLGNLLHVLLFERFRPLVNLSYAVDYHLWGTNTLGYHLTSVLLHAGCVVLCSIFVERLVRAEHVLVRAAPAKPATTGAAGQPAPDYQPAVVGLVAASILAVHPLLTEGVAYVSGRSEVLCGLFVLAALLCFQRFFSGGGALAVALGVLFWFLSLGSREVAAMLPFLLLAYDFLLLGPAGRRRRMWLHAPLTGIVFAAGLVRVALYLRETSAPGSIPAWHYIQTQFGVTWRYLGLFVLPINQSVMHEVDRVRSAADPAALLAGAGLVALTWVTWRLRHRWPLLPFGFFWFLLLLAPSALVPLREMMAEHRAYLACYGLVIAVTAVGAAAVGSPQLRGSGAAFKALVGAATVVALLLMGTVARNRAWHSSVSLFEDAVRKAPTLAVARRALGDEYLWANRCADAIPHFREAVALGPPDPNLQNNLGICLARVEKLDEARQVLETLAKRFPRFAKVYNNLGMVAANQGRFDDAKRHYRQTLALDPGNQFARQALAQLTGPRR